jgi:predicted Zn-dependent protease
MASAGFDPNGALGFLKTLDEERALNPVDIPAYLMTHPVTSERVANMQQVIRSLGNPAFSVEVPDPLKKIQLILRMERGDGAAALAAYEKLGAEKPNSAEVLYLLGLARQLRGQSAQAQQSYERALELSPNNPSLLRDLGRLYAQLGNTDKAEMAFHRSLELQPQESLTYLYLGELHEKRNDFRSAVGAYQNAHTLSPLWDKPPYHLGIVYGKLDRLGDAYYYLARSLLLQDEDEKALAALEKAAKIVGAGSPRGQLIREELQSLKARRK